jgi:hypothetical protein
MANLKEISSSLYGAYRIARLDPDASQYFNLSTPGFYSSFSAMLIAVPFFALENAFDFKVINTETGLIPFLIILCIALVVSWGSYLAIVGILTKYMGISEKFGTFVIVYNWSQLAIIALWLPISVLLSGLVGGEAVGTISLLFIGATYVYLWQVLRLTLGVSGSLALGFAFLEFLTAIMTQVIFSSWLFTGSA